MVWATPVIREGLILNNLGFLSLICFLMGSFIISRRNPHYYPDRPRMVLDRVPSDDSRSFQPSSRWGGYRVLPHYGSNFFRGRDFLSSLPHSFHVTSFKSRKNKKVQIVRGSLLFGTGMSWIVDSHFYNRLWHDQKTYARYWLHEAPQIKSVYSYLAYAYSLEGNLTEARRNYLLSLTGTANDGQMYMNLGLIERKWGHFKEAEAYYQTGLKMLPSSFGIYANLGSLYYRYGKLDLAKEYYIRALIRNPSALPVLEALISISIRQKDLRAVTQYVNFYLEKEKRPQMLMRLGDVMAQDHLWGLALRSYHKAADNDPDNGQVQGLITKRKIELFHIFYAFTRQFKIFLIYYCLMRDILDRM